MLLLQPRGRRHRHTGFGSKARLSVICVQRLQCDLGNDFRCWQCHSMADHGLRVPGGPGRKVYSWEPPTGRSPCGPGVANSNG